VIRSAEIGEIRLIRVFIPPRRGKLTGAQIRMPSVVARYKDSWGAGPE
jgi:hypothetical protein